MCAPVRTLRNKPLLWALPLKAVVTEWRVSSGQFSFHVTLQITDLGWLLGDPWPFDQTSYFQAVCHAWERGEGFPRVALQKKQLEDHQAGFFSCLLALQRLG